MKTSLPLRLVALLGVGLAACVNTGLPAPAAPRFDLAAEAPVVSRLATIDVAGSAEYGATLTLTSDQSFGGEKAPADVVADPYTARFLFTNVGLAKGKNTLTLVATDAQGRKSPPATLEVTYEDAPSAMVLSLDTPSVVAGTGAGEGSVTATAKIVGGVDGFQLDGREIDFALAGVGTDTKSATTDATGRATVTFTGLTQAGVGTVSAEVKDAADVTDAATFVVSAGPAANVKLALEAAGGDGHPADPLALAAGDDALAVVTVTDASGNPVVAPVQLFTNAPGALVAGSVVTNLHVTGTFQVVAAVAGVPTEGGVAVSGAATLTVSAGPAAALSLTAPATATAGEPFAVGLALTDAYGNPTTPAGTEGVQLASSTDPSLTFVSETSEATLSKAGRQTLTATVTGSDATIAPATATVTVSAGAPTALALTLAASTEAADPANALGVSTAVTDAFGNAVPAAVTVKTDAPGLFDGGSIRGVTKAGSYTVTAALPNTTLAAAQTFTVTPTAATKVALALSATSATAGAPVTFVATGVDAYGNATDDAVSVGVDGDQTPADFTLDTAAKTLTITKAGAATVRASAAAAGSTLAAATATLVVTPAAAKAIAIDSGPSTTVPAGSTPPFTVQVTDAFGNVLDHPAVTQSVVPAAGTLVEPPGPEVSAGRIYNLVRPGTYELIAQVVGTDLVNDPANPNATLTVTAADAAKVELTLARASADVGTPVGFTVDVVDAYGNAAQGTPTVQVKQGDTVVAPNVGGTSWTPVAAGSYTFVATLTAGQTTLTDSALVVVSDAPDTAGPTLAFQHPDGDPTVPSWPPPGATSPASCAGAGDVLSITASDPSLVGKVWLDAGGAALSFASPPSLDFPLASASFTEDVCTTGAGAPARGEVLATFAAADLKGNYAELTGGWCVDPDAAGYLPANPPANRCVVAKASTALASAFALAADAAGDLAVAREASNGDARVQLFSRSGTYGAGAEHAVTGFASPRGVALVGHVAFTSAVSTSKMALVRTRDLDLAGGGTDDPYVLVDSSTDRFDGVVVGADGALYATSGVRPSSGSYATFASKLWKFDRPLDFSNEVTQLPSTPVATFDSARLTGLCAGSRADHLYAVGYTQSSGKTLPTLVDVDLTAGTSRTVFTGTVDGQQIGGCAATAAGVAVTLSKGAGQGQVALVDAATGTLSTPLLTGYATASPLDRPSGLALTQGYLFALSTEGTGSSLARFARAGGF